LPFAFKGGVHPNGNKNATRHKPVEIMPPPERIILPMSMHIGTPCEPLVRVGEQVKMGQKIGEAMGAVSAPIHSSVSGKVEAIEFHPHIKGTHVLSVFIENDGLDTPHEDMRPHGSMESLSPEELLTIVKDAGIVGMGGAAFPTHVKISSVLGKVDKLIINAAECEPYITSGHRLMLEAPEELIGGVRALMKMLGLSEATIAVEANKRDAMDMVRRTLPRKKSNIKVISLPTRYPQGAERQLIKALTGREVTSGQLPVSVGCAVFNVETAASIHRAITTGLPLVRRIVTVSGSAVSNPKNLLVRIGSTLTSVFGATGGFRETPYKIITGGPLMGNAQFNLDTVITKATNALLAFSRKEDARVDDPICIRCGKCVSVCPMNLLPIYMYMREQKDNMPELEKLGVHDCIECGCCSYTCPGRLYLVQSFRTGKEKLAVYKKAQEGGAEVGA